MKIKTSLHVNTDICGSHCVVWRRRGHYIDARTDVRLPNHTVIEVVRSGMVYIRECVHNLNAPERVIELMRSELL